MLLGVLSVEEAAAGGGGSSALGVWDFVAGTYSFNGTTLAASDCIDHPEWITANGLEIGTISTTLAASIIYSPARALLNTHAPALMMNVEFLSNRDDTHWWLDENALLALEDSGSGQALYWLAWQHDVAYGGFEMYETDATSGSTIRDCWDETGLTVGAHKVAFQRTSTASRIARGGVLNPDDGGDQVQQPNTSCAQPNNFTDFHIGGSMGGGIWTRGFPNRFYVRQIAFANAFASPETDLAAFCA